jgi:hypothetical protein
MLFFCPLDNIHQPTPTTLAEQRKAIAQDGTRKRQGLCVDALNKKAATDTVTAYLLDCIRSGYPGYAPTVEIADRDGVPVASLMDGAPTPTRAEAAALAALQARAAARAAAPPHIGPSAPAPVFCVTPEPSNDNADPAGMDASSTPPV